MRSHLNMHLQRFLGFTVLLACLAAPVYGYSEYADRVILKKGARKLILMKGDKVLKSYRVALGGNPVGHKQQEGDQRTPEGNYTLDSRNSGSKFYKSIHISYPDSKDRKNARQRGVSPGGAIMIHGAPNNIKNSFAQSLMKSTDWTDGCVAVTNREMDEIWKMVRNGTPITIEP